MKHNRDARLAVLARLAKSFRSISEVAKALGFSRPTLYHYLNDLERAGMVRRSGLGGWNLTAEGVAELAKAAKEKKLAEKLEGGDA